MFPLVPLEKLFWDGNVTLKLYFLCVGLSLLSGCSLFEKNLLVTSVSPPLRAWQHAVDAYCECWPDGGIHWQMAGWLGVADFDLQHNWV